MEFTYRKANLSDLDILVDTRIEVLRAANQLPPEVEMSAVKRETLHYYETCFQHDMHVAFLVYQAQEFAGCGGISFYTILPTYHNPSGRHAYIMNLYTRPQFRRNGVARRTLDLLIAEAKSRRIQKIALETTNAGKALYENYGFLYANDEMYLPMYASSLRLDL